MHIGGHIAFEIEQIAHYCRDHGIFLIEDCAHAHGATWHGRRAGTWGDAGLWSFAATKTISTGEGGMLVSGNDDLIEYARSFRNYGKPSYEVAGLNFRTERVHGSDRPRADRADGRDRGVEEPAAREHLDAVHSEAASCPTEWCRGSTSTSSSIRSSARPERSTTSRAIA